MSAEDREPLSTTLSPAPVPAGAVFLSYASEDADAAERMATALASAGIQVWLDKSELRGGDAWDRQIRQQIHDCRLFIALISAHTEARDEGYFRREWKLAVDRTHDMAEKRTFIVPVVVDGTSERGASVPDKFRELQWTRLPGGDTPPAFVQRVRRLLSPEAPSARVARPVSGLPTPVRQPVASVAGALRSKAPVWVTSALLVGVLAYIAVDKLWIQRHTPPPTPSSISPAPTALRAPATAAEFSPPPHSVAVLPFVNMSGDKDQEYFSDGLTEELLNSLTRINELQVAGRTSSFYFKGKDVELGAIARKLNVADVLEGSVRRSGHRVRITAQLINAVTGFHLWSETYDRDLSDILKLQTEIANAVTSALKVTLLGDVAEKIELGGTRNPNALDAYLRGQQFLLDSEEDIEGAIAAFSDAIRLDPSYALALAVRSRALNDYATNFATTAAASREALDKAQADAHKAIALAPDLGESHLALALFYETTLNFALAIDEYERALSLSPGNVRTLWRFSSFAVSMGRTEAGIAAARRAVVLDPLQWISRQRLGWALYSARRYPEAVSAFKAGLALRPETPSLHSGLGWNYYTLGDFQNARASCERYPDEPASQLCLAVTYERLGRHADAETALAKSMTKWSDTNAFLYALVYAQWDDTAKALEWLETALRLRDPGLEALKVEPSLDPLRNEPRFQAIERKLKFPN
jgi:TolB-like protein/Flp pilus assembly protein TadD